jgi:hypothetical protein
MGVSAFLFALCAPADLVPQFRETRTGISNGLNQPLNLSRAQPTHLQQGSAVYLR